MSDTVERPVDVELLSAYLDGALTTEERAAVEAQLAVSAAWRDELASLRWTVSLTSRTPDVAPPRSFELALPIPGAAVGTAVEETPRPWWANTGWLYGLMRGATAVSVALLLAVVGLDAWQTSRVGPTAATSMSATDAEAPVAAPAPAAAVAGKAPVASPKSASQPQAPAVQSIPAAPSPFPQGGAPAAGGGGGVGPGAGAGAGGDASSAPAAGAPVVRQAAGTPAPAPAAAEAAPFGVPTLGAADTQARGAPPVAAQATGIPRAVPAPSPPGNPYRAAEIGLAVLAAVFGMGAIVLRALMRR